MKKIFQEVCILKTQNEKKRPALLFIDLANLMKKLKYLNKSLDFPKFLKHLEKQGYELICKKAFFDYNMEKDHIPSGFLNFIFYLLRLEILTIPVQMKTFFKNNQAFYYSQADNVLAANMIKEITKTSGQPCSLILVSGDKDFVDHLENCRSINPLVKIIIFSTDQSLSHWLRQTADEVFLFEDFPELLKNNEQLKGAREAA